jgi:AcrR family transcriptional regulator
MPSTTATGPGRRAGLDAEEVVAAALALVEAGGAEALTMRKLAADLGVGTTTIYWHVGSRDELIAAIIRRRSQEQAARPIRGATARDRIASVASNVRRGALEHPHVTTLAYQVGALSDLEGPLERALAAELAAAGLRGKAAADAMRAILLCVAGFIVVGLEDPAAAKADARLFDRTIRAVIADRMPSPEEAP